MYKYTPNTKRNGRGARIEEKLVVVERKTNDIILNVFVNSQSEIIIFKPQKKKKHFKYESDDQKRLRDFVTFVSLIQIK